MENEMVNFKAGDYIEYGYRHGPYIGQQRGGIERHYGVIMPFGGGPMLYMYSGMDCEIHALRRLANGQYILNVEVRDDPKQRLWVSKVQADQFKQQYKNSVLNVWTALEHAKNEMNSDWIRELYNNQSKTNTH
jgi:hypothetical protein